MEKGKDMVNPVNRRTKSPQYNAGSQKHSPSSPVSSCVSMMSEWSMADPPNLSSDPGPSDIKSQKHNPSSPVSSCLSLKSEWSMADPPNLSSEPDPSDINSQKHRSTSPVTSCVSMMSEWSMADPPNLSSEPAPSDLNRLKAYLTQDPSRCGVCEEVLRDPIITTTCGHTFCSQCVSSYLEQPGLSGDQNCPKCKETCGTQPPQPPLDEHTDRTGSSRALKQGDKVLRRVIENHKSNLKCRFENVSEGIVKSGTQVLLNKIYTELYITEVESEGVNKEHEVWQIETASRTQTALDTPISCNDVFNLLPGQQKHIRTVMTKGVAGIGKTVSVQKFILDWIDGIANQNVDFIFPFPFRELNLVKGDQYSLQRLLLDFHPELKELEEGEEYKDCQVVFIFDGLDESRLYLDFEQNIKFDLKQISSVDVLVTSLLKGTLFPSAFIWITSRPAASSQIPAQYIDQVTEIRGFSDPQKEEYFRKRISDGNQALRILSHIKASRSLHIMCHIPVFCWITATVLQQMLEHDNTQEIPKTLTEMFVNFLLIQITRKDQKYQGRWQLDIDKLLESHKHIILKLAELAYKHLLNGNLMFYEEDLKECGINVSEASVYSGMCTEIFKEESVFHQRKVYCFVHLSIQEFLAAVFVFHSFVCLNDKLNAPELFVKKSPLPLEELLQKAVDKALQSKNGHLDLFLRFLTGISLEKNHRLLQGLLTQPLNTSEGIRKTCKYIKELNRENLSPERCINLLHCLFEMNDHSMHQEIKKYLESPQDFKGQLSPAHCSALAHMILMSEGVLDEFDLKKYNTSDEGRRRLIPAMKCCRKARFADCKITDKSCRNVVLVLQSPNSLTELDLSHNDLGDSGVQFLCKGLASSHCKLQTLRLSHCSIFDEGYVCLALTLMLNPSCVKELDVSNNHPGESAQSLLSATLEDPSRNVETLQLADCKLTDKSCEIVSSVLQSPNSLIMLELSHNDVEDSGFYFLSKGLSSPHSKLQTLRLAGCRVTGKSCEIAASLLQSPNSLIELELSHNDLASSGVQLLSKGLSSAQCQLQKLRLSDCKLTSKSCRLVASVLQSPNSLKELDLSHNDLRDSGVQLLCEGLSSPQCKLHTLRLSKCGISDEGFVCLALTLMLRSPCVKELDVNNNHPGESAQALLTATLDDPDHKPEILRLDCKLSYKSYEIVASVLQSPNSLIELDLSNSDLGDSGVQLLSKGLSSRHCRLQTLSLVGCRITEKSGKTVASVLKSPNSLMELDLSHNYLGDGGVQPLCKGLSSPHCKLQTLRLTNCLISEKGCACLASALTSNPSFLKELDLSGNPLGESGLSAKLEDPVCQLMKFKSDYDSVHELRPRLQIYSCKLTLDPNTAGRLLSLSEGNRKVTCLIEEQLYPDHPERFDWPQVLCREGLSGRCYWEAEWSGREARIAVAYKSIKRREWSNDRLLGYNDKSWSLRCTDDSYSVRHNNKCIDIIAPLYSRRRIGVHLDCLAGTLSFYSVHSDTLTHLHTFHSTFTEPLYPGFFLHHDSSVSLCQIT